jgi:hypothetical protein
MNATNDQSCPNTSNGSANTSVKDDESVTKGSINKKLLLLLNTNDLIITV